MVRSEPTVFKETAVEGKFSIPIPEYLSKTDSINPSALLQYQNAQEQVFLMVFAGIDTLHQPMKEGFKRFAGEFVSRMEKGNMLNYHPEKINGCEAILGDIRGRINETEVYYLLAMIRSGKYRYRIITGVSAQQKSKYKEDLLEMIRGFKIRS